MPVGRRGEDEDLVVVVEAADVGGQPDEAYEAVLVAVERPNLKYDILWKFDCFLDTFHLKSLEINQSVKSPHSHFLLASITREETG